MQKQSLVVVALSAAAWLGCAGTMSGGEEYDPPAGGGQGNPNAGGQNNPNSGGSPSTGGNGNDTAGSGGVMSLPPAGGSGGTGSGTGTGGIPSGGGTSGSARLFQDGFESYDERAYNTGDHLGGGDVWLVETRNATVLRIDSSKPFSGGKSLHISAPAGSDRYGKLNFGAPILPMPDNVVYGRAMIFLQQTPSAVHWNFFGAGGVYQDPQNGRFQSLSWDWGGHNSGLQAFYSENDCWFRPGERAMPQSQWVCWQWKFEGSSPDKRELFVWMRGAPAPVLYMRGSPNGCSGGLIPWLAPQFGHGYVGWESAQPSSVPIEVWIDDVAFDNQPIACPAM